MIIRKNKQTIIFIRSNEIVFAIAIFLNANLIKPDVNDSSSASALSSEGGIYPMNPFDTSNSDYFQFLTSSVEGHTNKWRGGADQFSTQDQEKLVKSLIDKTKELENKQKSLNKILEKCWGLIKPVIENKRI